VLNVRREERDGAMLFLDVFDVVAAFPRALALQASCGFSAAPGYFTSRRQLRRIYESLGRERWRSRHIMVSLPWRAPPTLEGPSPRHHPGSREPHPGRTSVKQRSPLAGRGMMLGQIFVTLANYLERKKDPTVARSPKDVREGCRGS